MAKKATVQRRRASVPRDPELTPDQAAFIASLPADMVIRAGAKKGATKKGFALSIPQWLAIIEAILGLVKQITNKGAEVPDVPAEPTV